MARRGELRVTLSADTKPYRREMKQAAKEGGNFGKGVAKGLKFAAIGAGAVGAAFGALAVSGIQDFTRLDKKVREVGTLLGDVNDADLSKLTKEIENVATATGQAAEEVASSFYDSISAGIPRERVEDFVKDAAKFATAGGTEIGAATDLLTSAINAHGLKAEDASMVSDVFFGAVKAGKTTVDELGASFFNVGPIAASMGADLESTAGWLASLTLTGTPTSVAATQIKAALSELGKAGSKADVVFQDFVGKSFPEFIKSGGSVEDAMAQLEAAANDQGKSMTEVFGSIEAAQAVMGITGAGFETFTGIVEGLGDSAGATDQAFETMSGSVEFQQKKLGEQFGAIKRQIGAAFIPALQTAMGFISETVVPLIGEYWPVALQAAKDAFATISDYIETHVVPIWEGVLQPALERVWGWVSETLVPWFQEKIPAALAVVTAYIQGTLVPIWENTLQPALQRVWEWISTTLVPWFQENIPAALEEVRKFIDENLLPIWEQLQTQFEDLYEWAQENLIPWFEETLPEVLRKLEELIQDPLIPTWEMLREKLVEAGEWVRDNLVPIIASTISKITEWVTKNTEIVQAIGAFIATIGAAILVLKAIAVAKTIYAVVTGVATGAVTLFNAAMAIALSPITLVIAGIALLVAGFVLAYNKVDWFRNLIDNFVIPTFWTFLDTLGSVKDGFFEVWDGIVKGFPGTVNAIIGFIESIPNTFISAINSIIHAWNRLSFGIPGKKIGPVSFPGFQLSTPNISPIAAVHLPRISTGGGEGYLPHLAEGGIVLEPTIALIGEQGPEAVIPLRNGAFGQQPINVYFLGDVYGGSPATMGDAVIRSMTNWQRVNGSLPSQLLATAR